MYASSVDLTVDGVSRVPGASDLATVVFETDTDSTSTIKDSTGNILWAGPAYAGSPNSATFTVSGSAAIGGLTIVATTSLTYPAGAQVQVYDFVLGTGAETFSIPATTYSITFSGNGADNPDAMLTDMMSLTYDQNTTLVSNAYMREGYTFEGWNTLVDGTGTSHTNEASVINLTGEEEGAVTLYAQWTEVSTPIITDDTATTEETAALSTGATTTLAQTEDTKFVWTLLILGVIVAASISLLVLRKKVQ
jgi:uncharacterized repeat protein (TIGR02543 family)